MTEVRTPIYLVKHGRLERAPSQGTAPGSPDIQPWSGWVDVACSTCHLRYVNANFKVPSVSCSDSIIGSSGYAYASFWVGLDGYGDSTVEQDGIVAYCTSKTGSPTYVAFWEMYPDLPHQIPRTVKAGNSISISVYYDQSNGKYQLTFHDSSDTAGTWTSPYESCPSGSTCRNKTAEVIVENPGGGPPESDMPDFGSVAFSGTTVTSLDGTKGDLCPGSLWGSEVLDAEDSSGNILAYPGPLTTCSGPDGFTDYFLGST